MSYWIIVRWANCSRCHTSCHGHSVKVLGAVR